MKYLPLLLISFQVLSTPVIRMYSNGERDLRLSIDLENGIIEHRYRGYEMSRYVSEDGINFQFESKYFYREDARRYIPRPLICNTPNLEWYERFFDRGYRDNSSRIRLIDLETIELDPPCDNSDEFYEFSLL